MKRREWIRVTRANPCPVCSKPDFCSVSGELICCMRIESDRKAKGDFGGWIHTTENASHRPELIPKRERPRPNIDFHTEARRMFEHDSAETTRANLALSLGVSCDALKRLGVGFGADKREFSSWPERGIDGRVSGIVRRYADGSKKSMFGSHHGLYFAVNWRESTDLVLCPEGGSDTAAALSMGLFALGRPSNVGGVSLLIAKLKQIRPLRVIVLGERDEKPDRRGQPETPSCKAECKGCPLCAPGRYGMLTTADRIRAALKRTEVQSRLPPAKDVRAWLNSRRGNGDLAGRFLSELVFE